MKVNTWQNPHQLRNFQTEDFQYCFSSFNHIKLRNAVLAMILQCLMAKLFRTFLVDMKFLYYFYRWIAYVFVSKLIIKTLDAGRVWKATQDFGAMNTCYVH